MCYRCPKLFERWKDSHVLFQPFHYPTNCRVYKCSKIPTMLQSSTFYVAPHEFTQHSCSQCASRANICSIQVTIYKWFVNILPFKTHRFCWQFSLALPICVFILKSVDRCRISSQHRGLPLWTAVRSLQLMNTTKHRGENRTQFVVPELHWDRKTQVKGAIGF